MNRSQETRLAKLEQVRGARARRYCFYFGEEAEAEAQGLPYILVPRVLSEQEWIEKYSLHRDGRVGLAIRGHRPGSRSG
jgi:hypothetical protein